MRTLVALSYSPWSEKARWALRHHRVEFQYREYLPMLGEPALRVRARRPFARVTVPLLVDGRDVYDDSRDIARFAERVGSGAPLFGEGREAAIDAWNARSEAGLEAGRGFVMRRIGADRAAQAEALPPLVPASVRKALAPIAQMGVAYIARKYALHAAPAEAHERVLRESCAALREALAGGKRYLLDGTFSYADVTMAAMLQAVQPVANEYIRLGPATRIAWTHPDLARAYADLLDWRDRVYETHRDA